MFKKLRRSFIIPLCLVTSLSFAQVGTKSPYSLSAFGEVRSNVFVMHRNLGGASRALQSEQQYSVVNPASYASLKNVVYNAGLDMRYGRIKADTISGNVSNANFSYFSMAFASPYNSKMPWGMSFGFNQMTDVGYDLKSLNNDTLNSYSIFKGEGGLSTAYLGLGVSPFKGLSVGANANYNFGAIRSIKALVYPNVSHFSFSDENSTYYKGFNFDFGVQYNIQKGEMKHTIGATYHTGVNMKGKGYRYAETFFGRLYDTEGTIETVDTLLYIDSLNSRSQLPSKFGIAYSVSKGDNWMLTAEYERMLWSAVNSDLNQKPYFDNERYSLGFVIVPKPDFKSSGEYFKKVSYSLGLRYEKLFYNFFDQQIDELGIGFGLGLPVVRTFSSRTGKVPMVSKVNLGIEYTKRGTTDYGLVAEEYLTIRLGLNFNDKWFIKRKYQ